MSTSQPSPIGQLLRRLRTAAALSQEDLAERTGLSVRAISDLERGVHHAPRLETVRLLSDALALDAADRAELLAAARPEPAATPAGSFGQPSLAPLPLPPTRLIGREAEVAALHGLLLPGECRLITLTGPGGVGKTRLALAVADSLAGAFADGAVLVDLTPIRDPALVASAIAACLGLRETGAPSLAEQLAYYLRQRAMLLVLDNFEQVLDAAPVVTKMLGTAPRLRVLVTSREPLRLSGEHVVPVPPLALPDAGQAISVDDAQWSAAVTLFVDRAQAADPGFALSAENAAAIAGIVRRLDGLPLAIELAAARVRTLLPEALLPYLANQPLRLLTGGPRDQPDRQRTMRDAIGWSYDLLAPADQRLFRMLAVFVGGFSLESAGAVAVGGKDLDLLDRVAALIDKGLVRRMEGSAGELRFTMLETIREFGVEQLAAAGEEVAIRNTHVAWVVSLAEQAEAELMGREQARWLQTLDVELPNLRAALGWLEQTGNVATRLRVASAVTWFWVIRGHVSEGRAWLEGALTDEADAPPSLRARAMLAVSALALGQHDYYRALASAEASLAIADRISDVHGIAAAQFQLGMVAQMQGDYALAVARLEEALALWRQLGDPVWVGQALTQLGDTVLGLSDLDRASALHEEALITLRESGGPSTIALTLACFGNVVIAQGDLARAEVLLRESLTLAFEVEDRWFLGDVLASLAITAERRGQFQRAAWLIGTVDAERARTHAPLMFIPVQAAHYAQTIEIVRAQLGDEAFAAAHAAGRSLSLTEVIGEVMRESTHDVPGHFAHELPQHDSGGS